MEPLPRREELRRGTEAKALDSRPIVVIVGPTASGKTELAGALRERLSGRGVLMEIIGADARQIYRGLSVGTAKPSESERGNIPHHMIDVADPAETFSAARFAREARACASGIYSRGALPVVVGGSGLYIRALVEGLFEGPGAQPALRRSLELEVEKKGLRALHERLAACDPETAARVHPHDRKRIIRALEVHEATGRPISLLRAESPARGFRRPLYIGIKWPAEILAHRIAERVRRMLRGGMLDEAVDLARLGLTGSRSFEGLGYVEVLSLSRGELDFEEAADRIGLLHRAYAKRQRTWFRKIPEVLWLEADRVGMILAADAASGAVLRYLDDFPRALRGVRTGEARM